MEDKKFLSIDEMTDKLEKCGSREVWLAIERIGKWQDRVAYRQLFFLAGGSLDE